MKKNIADIRTILIAFVSTLFIMSCGAAVPSKAIPKVTRIEKVVLPENTMVTLGPRRLLSEISHEIEESGANIEVIDGLLFRDTAFPNGGWTLQELLNPKTCSEVNRQLNVNYLVLVGSSKVTSEEEEGFMIPLLVGAMSVESASTLSAVIFDLGSGDQICQITSEARGKERVFAYVIFVVGSVPQIKTASIEGLANEVISVITELGAQETKRIAIMAAEVPL
jgi:hypothetical protein